MAEDVEVLFRCNDTIGPPESQLLDGMVLLIRPTVSGIITSAEIIDYFQNGTAPAVWGEISEAKQESIRRVLEETKWLTAPSRTAEQVADQWDPDWQTYDAGTQAYILAKMAQMISVADSQRSMWLTFGLDPNWGSMDLYDHGVIKLRLPNNTYLRFLEEMDQPPDDQTRHWVAPRRDRRARRYRVRYWEVFDAATVANLRNPAVYVPAPHSMGSVNAASVAEKVT